MSQRATSQAFELLNTSAAVFDDEEGEPSSFLAPRPAPDVPPTRLFLALLLALNLYFDSSVALWQNVYKDARIRQDGPDCTAVHDWILSNKDSFGAKLWAAPGCPEGLLQSDQPDPQALFARRLAEEESVEKEDQQCSWKAVVHVPTGRLKCKPQSFTKGCALFFQAMGGLIMWPVGTEGLRQIHKDGTMDGPGSPQNG
ncbi:unnamed protein product [Effrenium voratum]|nr:unnamed protein product [Effrenium voratum]